MMIDDQIRELLGEGLRPDLRPLTADELQDRARGASRTSSQRWLLVAACFACLGVLGGGLLMLGAPDSGGADGPVQSAGAASATSIDGRPTGSPVTSPISPPSSATPPSTETMRPTASDVAAPQMERVVDTEIIEYAGTYTMDYRPASFIVGTTGSFSLALEMTDSSFCVRTQDSSGCESTDDGTPLADTPRSIDVNASGNGDKWLRYAIAPSGVQVRFVDSAGQACDMFEFSLAPYSTASLWACEGNRPAGMNWQQWHGSLWDLIVTRNDRTLIATMTRPITTATPMSDPITTTGYRIGDSAPTTDPATKGSVGPWLLVVDDNSRIVGYVRTNEYANPSFDGIVLTYDEQGLRNGELNRNGWRLITTPSL